MPQDYTIIVTVTGDSQREAFRWVEQALSEYAERHEDLSPEGIHVSTPDGVNSVEL